MSSISATSISGLRIGEELSEPGTGSTVAWCGSEAKFSTTASVVVKAVVVNASWVEAGNEGPNMLVEESRTLMGSLLGDKMFDVGSWTVDDDNRSVTSFGGVDGDPVG